MDTTQPENGIPFKNRVPFIIKGDWNIHSARLKEKFPELTDGDLKHEKGCENEMIKSLEARLYKDRDEVLAIIEKIQA